MIRTESNNTGDRADDARASTASMSGWIVSLAFWLSLLVAAVCFAAVALSPKLLVYVTLRAEYGRNQSRLVALERQVAYLERVRDTLENDPDFAAELARADRRAAAAEDERIAVGLGLSLESALSPASGRSIVPDTPSVRDNPVTREWYSPLLASLARHRFVRISLLSFAAVVTLAAFTFLDESQSGRIGWILSGVKRRCGWIAARYRKPPHDA